MYLRCFFRSTSRLVVWFVFCSVSPCCCGGARWCCFGGDTDTTDKISKKAARGTRGRRTLEREFGVFAPLFRWCRTPTEPSQLRASRQHDSGLLVLRQERKSGVDPRVLFCCFKAARLLNSSFNLIHTSSWPCWGGGHAKSHIFFLPSISTNGLFISWSLFPPFYIEHRSDLAALAAGLLRETSTPPAALAPVMA